MSVEDEKREGAPLSYLGALGWTFGASGLVALVGLVAAGLRPNGGFDVGTAILCEAVGTLILLVAMARVHAPDERMRDIVGMRPTPVVLSVLALVAGASLVFVLAPLDETLAVKFPLDGETAELFAVDTTQKRVVLGLAILASPFFTEVFYRGAIFGLLERDKPRSMTVFVTTLLCVFPPSLHNFFSAFVLTAVASHARGLSRSLWPALALRLGYAGVIAAYLFAHHEEDTFSRSLRIGGGVASAIAIAFFVGLATAHNRSGRPA
jgi:membrane protease YdiL (CAAX protease family)